MSKLNCPLLKSKSVIQASKNKKQFLVGTLLSLALGLGASISFQFSAIASLAHKETELVSIHAIAEALQAETTPAEVAISAESKSASLAAL